jgi:hypothetical protein
MRIRVTLTCFIIALLVGSSAFAVGPIQEVVRPNGLLLLGDFRQWVTLSYEYTGHSSSSANFDTSINTFKEKYHLNTDVSIMDPHLLNLRLDGDVWLEQGNRSNGKTGSGSSERTEFRYNLLGTAFDTRYYPMTFVSFRELTDVVTPFSPSYTTDSSQHGFNFSLLNKVLPVQGQYMHRTLDTTGLGQDSSSISDDFNLRVRHDFRDRSHTEIYTSYFKQNETRGGIEPTSSRNYMLSLTNSTYFDDRKRYSLSSQLQGSQGESTGIPRKTMDWNETLDCRFGAALQGNFSNWYSYDRTLGFDGREQLTSTDTINASLWHRLYQSLETRIAGRYRTGEVLSGNETEYAGSIGLTYTKKLPAASTLILGVLGEHQVTDRNLLGSDITVRDKEYKNVQQGDILSLTSPGMLVSVISVQSRNPDRTYIVGDAGLGDYTIDYLLGRVTINPGGAIVPGTDLFISFVYRVNPAVKYSTDTVSSTGTLSLFNNRYRLMVNTLSQDQDLISGQATNVSLTSTRSDLVHFDANYLYNILSMEYSDYSANATKYRYFEGAWLFNRQFPLWGVSFRARDRYTMYDAASNRRGYSENTMDLGASYTRSLFYWAQATLTMNYLNTSGDNISRDYAYIRANLQGRINKLFINFIGQSTWRMSGKLDTRDDYVRFELTRYF